MQTIYLFHRQNLIFKLFYTSRENENNYCVVWVICKSAKLNYLENEISDFQKKTIRYGEKAEQKTNTENKDNYSFTTRPDFSLQFIMINPMFIDVYIRNKSSLGIHFGNKVYF
jgi:hypothetical protein